MSEEVVSASHSNRVTLTFKSSSYSWRYTEENKHYVKEFIQNMVNQQLESMEKVKPSNQLFAKPHLQKSGVEKKKVEKVNLDKSEKGQKIEKCLFQKVESEKVNCLNKSQEDRKVPEKRGKEKIIQKKSIDELAEKYKFHTNRVQISSEDNPFEIVLLDEVGKVAQKIQNRQGTANFIRITDFNKTEINYSRYNFFGMLNPMDRSKAKEDFIKFSEECFSLEEQVLLTIREFKNDYSLKRDAIQTLKEYSKETFFYKILNKGLRTLKDPKQCYYLRFPFSDVFCSIRQVFKKQGNYDFRKKEFVCYRGCQLEEKQIKQFQNSKGEYFELRGFISTSLSEEIALKYCQNAIIEIKVQPKLNALGENEFGFANMKGISKYPEAEILFNAINLFKVLDVKKQVINQIQITRIQLEYESMSWLLIKNTMGYKQSQKEKQVVRNQKHQSEYKSYISNQGYIFYIRGNPYLSKNPKDHIQWSERFCDEFQKDFLLFQNGKLDEKRMQFLFHQPKILHILHCYVQRKMIKIQRQIFYQKNFSKAKNELKNMGKMIIRFRGKKSQLYCYFLMDLYGILMQQGNKLEGVKCLKEAEQIATELKMQKQLNQIQGWLYESENSSNLKYREWEQKLQYFEKEEGIHYQYFQTLQMGILFDIQKGNWEKCIQKTEKGLKFFQNYQNQNIQAMQFKSFLFIRCYYAYFKLSRYERAIDSLRSWVRKNPYIMFQNDIEEVANTLFQTSNYEFKKAVIQCLMEAGENFSTSKNLSKFLPHFIHEGEVDFPLFEKLCRKFTLTNPKKYLQLCQLIGKYSDRREENLMIQRRSEQIGENNEQRQLEELLESRQSEEELFSILEIVMSLDFQVKQEFAKKLIWKLLKKIQVSFHVEGQKSVKIIQSLKQNGDYENLKGALLYVMAEEHKTELDEETFQKIFRENLKTIIKYCKEKGDKNGQNYYGGLMTKQTKKEEDQKS